MFLSRKLKNKINKLHERCLRIVFSDDTSSFEEFLEMDNSASVHHQKIHTKNTRTNIRFHSRAIKSVTFGSQTLSHLAPKIWELVPVKNANVKLVV